MPASRVYVFSSGDSATDGVAIQALKDRGYQAILGPPMKFLQLPSKAGVTFEEFLAEMKVTVVN